MLTKYWKLLAKKLFRERLQLWREERALQQQVHQLTEMLIKAMRVELQRRQQDGIDEL